MSSRLKIIQKTEFSDTRGSFYCSWTKEDDFTSKLEFVEHDFSYNSMNVLRGMHCDFETWKLIECIEGEVFWAGYDLNPDERYNNSYEDYILSKSNRRQILIPPGVLAGFYTISKKAIVFYRQTKIYKGSSNQITVKWNDPNIGINWPSNNPLLSKRDASAKLLRDQKLEL